MVYRIGPAWSPSLEQIEAGLDAHRFVECGASQEMSLGWSEPRGEAHGPLVEAVGGQWILKLTIESKSVPASVVKRKAEEKLLEIEATTGRKPGKKETKEIREDVKQSLLPMAFTKRGSVLVWIDPKSRTLVIDAGSQSRADEVITGLVKAIDGFSVMQINTQLAPAAAMAEWLTTQEAPAGFSIDRECELKAADESKSVVKYARHALDIDEVRQHVADGKIPTKLAMTWEGRVSFMLTEGLLVKKITFLDGVLDEGTSKEKEDGFDADTAIATGEMQQLIPALMMALGGEVEIGVAAPVEAPAATGPAARVADEATDPADAPF
ncbi:MAG: recombination-associated protein RdgC [Rhodoferax sp.]|nr:recombination-associated protein RdgC [Rhodoferax sp.]